MFPFNEQVEDHPEAKIYNFPLVLEQINQTTCEKHPQLAFAMTDTGQDLGHLACCNCLSHQHRTHVMLMFT